MLYVVTFNEKKMNRPIVFRYSRKVGGWTNGQTTFGHADFIRLFAEGFGGRAVRVPARGM